MCLVTLIITVYTDCAYDDTDRGCLYWLCNWWHWFLLFTLILYLMTLIFTVYTDFVSDGIECYWWYWFCIWWHWMLLVILIVYLMTLNVTGDTDCVSDDTIVTDDTDCVSDDMIVTVYTDCVSDDMIVTVYTDCVKLSSPSSQVRQQAQTGYHLKPWRLTFRLQLTYCTHSSARSGNRSEYQKTGSEDIL